MMRRKVLFAVTAFIIMLTLSFLPSCIKGPEIQDDPDIQENNTYDSGNEETPDISEAATDKVVLALGNINIRSAPSTSEDNIVGLLQRNTTAEYIGIYNTNWNIIDYKGQRAYITASSKYTKVLNKDEVDSKNTIIENVINTGMKVLGTPYEYGATRILNNDGTENPYFTGNTFDCSSFVQYAFYVGGGIKLDATSRTQSDDGEAVSLNDIQRGDIILMTSTARQYNTGIERIGHVAIYLGDNKLLHTYGTGGVRITDFNSFWKGRYILARRMI